MKNPLLPAFLLLCLSGLNACSSVAPTRAASYHIKPLPLTTVMQYWQCREGSLGLRYTDNSKKHLSVRYRNQEYILEHQPSHDPVIYENSQIAFFGDGQSAVISYPADTRIILSGCRPQ